MKNKILKNLVHGVAARQFFLLVALILVLVGAQRISAVTTWADPTQDPPGGSIVAPVTVGVSSTTVQVVLGKLSMDTLGVFGNAFVDNILTVGTSVAPISPDTILLVDGSVAAKEYCDVSGGNCFDAEDVVTALKDIDEGIVCASSTMYSSMNNGPRETAYFNLPEFGESGYSGASSLGSVFGATANENRWDIVNVPSECRTSDGCIIRQKIYKRSYDKFMGTSGGVTWYIDKLYLVRDYEYRQEATSTLWWSSYNTAGTPKNDDTKSSNVIKPFSYLYLRDDANVTGGETDSDKFSAYDYTRGYGMEIYFCTEAAI